jgi:hypothetical protein
VILEILRFRLRVGAGESALLEADRRAQAEFAYQQPGMVRRTTARGDDGSWVIVDIWRSAADADRAAEERGSDRATEALMRLADPASVTSERFETLG